MRTLAGAISTRHAVVARCSSRCMKSRGSLVWCSNMAPTKAARTQHCHRRVDISSWFRCNAGLVWLTLLDLLSSPLHVRAGLMGDACAQTQRAAMDVT